MDTFAKRLIMALEERDMKAAELSRQAKIGESSMSQYKNGIHEPKQQKLQRTVMKVVIDNEVYFEREG